MPYAIAKRFSFSASHELHGLPEGHKCSRLHGHNYEVEVVLSAEELDEHSFVLDYGEMSCFGDFLRRTLDHRHLNDILPFQPSAENLACWLLDKARDRWPLAVGARVSETPGTWAEYRL
jgi:6-pyruvoyltetrahydropterin/6-carboxytetrahydropterin synthase